MKVRDLFMFLLDISEDTKYFFDPIINFFKNIWSEFNDFLTQFMSQDVANIFVFAIGVAIILIIVLAFMNKQD